MSEDKNQKLAERMEGSVSVLRQCARWRELFFYQKADALYQLTFLFCRRTATGRWTRWCRRRGRGSRTSWRALRTA